MPETVRIERLGRAGDGIAEAGGRPLYVPFALPAELVSIERREGGDRAQVIERMGDSPDRASPFCPYFGACGGCVAQHMAPPLYEAWKREGLASAMRSAALRAEPERLVDGHGDGRRRVTFHARFHGSDVRVGFMAPRSHDLVNIAACPVTEPRLAGAADAARALAAPLRGAGKPLDIQATATDGGLDIDIRGHGKLTDAERGDLVAAAERLDLARLSLHGDIIVERRPPTIAMGRAVARPPPGGFLQATRAGEEAIAALVVEAMTGARRVADLYAGCGPFAFRLAERAEVHAVEGNAAALAALDRAAREASGLRRVTTETRDLQRRPLLLTELSCFEAVVLDPPSAGAEPQCRQLAASAVPAVAMVSCDAGTFARDAAILVGSGFALERVVPIDQFKYSAHVEIVGVFRRAIPRGTRRTGRLRR